MGTARGPVRTGIYEINDAVSWRWLSTTYAGELDGRLAPDWIRVSRDWDGVHLSAMGLLLTYGVTWPDVAALRGWDCESTLWLRWSFSRAVALPVVAEEQLFRPEAWLAFLSDIVDPSPSDCATGVRRHDAGSLEQALDCACGLYLDDSTAWQPDPRRRTNGQDR